MRKNKLTHKSCYDNQLFFKIVKGDDELDYREAINRVFDRTDKRMQDILPLATFEAGSFRMQDGTYMNMVQIVTKDLSHLTPDALAFDELQFAKFYMSYSGDCKIIALNFPTNTKEQQKYFNHKLENTRNPIYRQFLSDNLELLQRVEKQKTEREYYIFYFGENIEELQNNEMKILATLGAYDMIHTIPDEKKRQIIEKINNKSRHIFI